MNRVKKWLAGVMTLAMVFTSVGLSNFGALNVFAANYTLTSMDGKTIEVAYTGEKIDVANIDAFARLKLGTDTMLYRGIDFDIESASINIGDGTAVITGLGNYASDTFTDLSFKIVAEDKDGYVVSVDESKFVYRGFTGFNGFSATDLEAATVVLFDGNKLSYDGQAPYASNTWRATFTRISGRENNIVAFPGDTFRATITATESDGTAKVIFEKIMKIQPKDLASVIDLQATNYTNNSTTAPVYNGKAQTPQITGFRCKFSADDANYTTFGSSNIYAVWSTVENGYENNINACSVGNDDCATAIIEADSTVVNNNFTGSAKVKFPISPRPINDSNVKLQGTTTIVTYNGQPQNPDLSIKAYFGTPASDNEIPKADYAFEYMGLPAGAEYPVNANDYTVRIVPSDNGNLTSDSDVTQSPALRISPASLTNATADLKGSAVPAETDLRAANAGIRKNLFDYFRIVTADGRELSRDEFTTGNLTVTYTGNDYGTKYNTEYEVTVSGSGDFKDSFKFKYTTGAQKLADSYTSNAQNIYFNYEIGETGGARPGTAQLGELTEDGTTNTLSVSDYVVTNWENWQAAGQAIAVIEGAPGSDYQGSTSHAVYTIKPFNLETNNFTAKVTGIESGIYAKGSEITGATVTVTDPKGPGTADDYSFTLSSDDCKVIADTVTGGTMTRVAVNGIGNYTGTLYADVTVVVTPANFNNAEVSGEIPAGLANYNEAAIKNYVTVTIDGKTVAPAGFAISDIKPATTGKALGSLGSEIEFTVAPAAGLLNASGSKTAKLTVVARDMADLDATATNLITLRNGDGTYAPTVNYGTYTYDGNEKKPSVRVNVAGSGAANVTADIDYEVSYTDNINAGWATVTLTGKGNYTGTTTRTFKINKYTVEENDFILVEPAIDKRQFKPGTPDDLSSELTIADNPATKANSAFVFDKSDYTIELVSNQKITSVSDHVNYKVKFTADSVNYNENPNGFTKYYQLARKTVTATNATITLGEDAFVYKKGTTPDVNASTGAPYFTGVNDRKHTVVVDGVTLTEGTDYDVTYEGTNKITSEITDGDTPQNVVFSFKGNYTSKVKVPFTIAESGIDLSQVFLKAPSPATYDGTAKIPTIDDHNKVEIDKAAYNIVIADASGVVVGTYGFNGTAWALTQKSSDAGQTGPINAGEYTATIKATAAYGGVTGNTLTYTIQQAQIHETEFVNSAKMVQFVPVDYAGKHTKAPIIINHANEKEYGKYITIPTGSSLTKEQILTAGDEFEVVDGSWDTDWNTSATDQSGNVKIQLKADSNYSYVGGPYDAKFTWVPVAVSKLADEVSIKDQIQTGKAINPTLDDIVIADGSILDKAWMTIDSYEGDLVNVGKLAAFVNIKVTVPTTEKRILSGTIKVPFNIVMDATTAAADEVSKQLAALAGEKAGLDDKAAVEAARKAYEELSAAAKAKVDPSALANLEAAEKAVEAAQAAADQAAADAVSNAAKALTDASTKEEAAAVVNAYLALTDAQKALVQKDATAVAALKAASEKSGIPIPGMEKKASKITIKNKAKAKVKRGKALTVKYTKTGNGKVTIKISGNKKVKKFFKVKGKKIKVAKKAKKGKYKVKVTVSIAATSDYKAAKKSKTIKVTVK